jgi:hypothetical protein
MGSLCACSVLYLCHLFWYAYLIRSLARWVALTIYLVLEYWPVDLVRDLILSFMTSLLGWKVAACENADNVCHKDAP